MLRRLADVVGTVIHGEEVMKYRGLGQKAMNVVGLQKPIRFHGGNLLGYVRMYDLKKWEVYAPWPTNNIWDLYVVAHEVGHIKDFQKDPALFCTATSWHVEFLAGLFVQHFFHKHKLLIPKNIFEHMRAYPAELLLTDAPRPGIDLLTLQNSYPHLVLKDYKPPFNQFQLWINIPYEAYLRYFEESISYSGKNRSVTDVRRRNQDRFVEAA
jgi:hypothetical protein